MDILYIIAEQTLQHSPLLIGAYISLSLMKVPDLSLESAFVGGAFIGSLILPLCGSLLVPLKLLILLIASGFGGGIVGMTSSLLTKLGKLPHLLSSILTFGIFYSLLQLIGGTYRSLHALPNPLLTNFIPQHPELPLLVGIGIFIGLIVQLLFKRQLGYALAVYGNNPRFFSHYGISDRFIFITGIISANILAGISGYLCAQSNGFADSSMGFGKVLLSITALILGKGLFKSQTLPSLMIPISGGLIYFGLQQLLIKSGLSLYYFSLFQSIIVLVILLVVFRNQLKQIDTVGV